MPALHRLLSNKAAKIRPAANLQQLSASVPMLIAMAI